jgi:hypothetical protein
MGTMYLVTDHPEPEKLVAWIQAADRAACERIEKNPWVHELRRAKAEAERTGSDLPLIAFEQRVFAARKAGDRWLT